MGSFLRLRSYCSIPDDVALLLLVIPRQPAIDKVGRTRDIVSVGRSQESCQTSDISRLPQPRQWNLGQQRAKFLRIVEQLRINRCFNGTRGNRVDGNAKLTEFHAEVARQHFKTALAGTVGSEVGEGQLFM